MNKRAVYEIINLALPQDAGWEDDKCKKLLLSRAEISIIGYLDL